MSERETYKNLTLGRDRSKEKDTTGVILMLIGALILCVMLFDKVVDWLGPNVTFGGLAILLIALGCWRQWRKGV